MSHKKCGGGPPCTRCVSKNVPCFPFKQDSSGRTRNTKQQQQTSVTDENTIRKQLEENSKQLLRMAQRYSELQDQQLELFSQLQRCKSRNDIETNLWNAPFNLRLPTVVHDANLTIIGGNESFRNMFREINQMDVTKIYELISPDVHEAYSTMAKWLLRSPICKIESYVILHKRDGTVIIAKSFSNYHRSFIVTTLMPVDDFSDEYIIDGNVVLPGDFRITHDNNQSLCKMLSFPIISSNKLFQHLLKISPISVFTDQRNLQEEEMKVLVGYTSPDTTPPISPPMMTPVTQYEKVETTTCIQQPSHLSAESLLQPVHLTPEELERVAARLNHWKRNA
jgi:hypothetical protein